jgi:hypothetical protein
MRRACRILTNILLENVVLENMEKDGMITLIFIIRNEVVKVEVGISGI